MRHLFLLFACVTLMFPVVGCGGTQEDGVATGVDQEPEPLTPEEEAAEEAIKY